MSALYLLADRPVQDHETALTELLEKIDGYKVKGMAVVFMVESEEPDGDDILAYYYRMSVRDKQLVASTIEGDVQYAIAEDAIRQFMGLREEEEDGSETA